MSIGNKYFLLALAGGIAFGAQAASARTLQVGTCTAADPHFDTIQSAVDAAFSGDKVAVCPGTYAEQVAIPRSITLQNVKGMAAPVIVAPPDGVVQNTTSVTGFPVAAQILVEPTASANVTIKNMIVDGSGNNLNSCAINLVGIYYKNAGGTISNNSLKNQILSEALLGCQDGLGIYVQAAPAAVVVTGNTVTNFQKGGIVMDRSVAPGEISNNTITGIGPTDAIAQNGIQLSRGSSALIQQNNVSNLIYTPATAGSSGILLYDLDSGAYLSPPSVLKNNVNNAQYGVVLDAANGTVANLLQVTGNNISNAQFAGVGLYSDVNTAGSPQSDDYIYVAKNKVQNTSPFDGIDACSDNNVIKKNTVTNSTTEAAIHLDSLCTQPDSSPSGTGNSVARNTITVACVGILSGPAEGQNSIGKNSFSDVTNPVVYGQDSYSCGSGARHAPRHRVPVRGKGSPLPGAVQPFRR